MQERPPGGERVGEDALQLLLAGYEGDLAGGAFHGGHQVAWVHLLRWSLGGKELRDLSPGLLHGHPAGQRVKRGVLGVRQHGLQRFQVRVAGEQPDQRQDLGVDAEPGEVSVADVREQPLVVEARRPPAGRAAAAGSLPRRGLPARRAPD